MAAQAAAGTKSEVLAATYVDPALTQQLASPNHQILYGRRGAGKTHALSVIEKRLLGRPSEVVIYADLRQLGDTRNQSPQEQAAVYIGDLLAILVHELTRRSGEGFAFARALPQLEAFRDVIQEQGFAIKETASEHAAGDSSVRRASLRAALDPTSPRVSGSLGSERESHTADRETISRIPVEQVDFTAVGSALRNLSRAANLKHLTLLLDEWSEVKPLETQPYLAEYIKRVFFPVEGLSVKIAAIQHRSRVGVRLAEGTVRGFEESADLFPLTMLDETAFSYDRDPAGVEEMYAELLYRHLTVVLAQAATEGNRPRAPVAPPPGGVRRWLARLRPGRRAPAYEEDIVSRVANELRRPDWGDTFFEATGDIFMQAEFGVSGAADLVADMFAGDAFRELVRGAQGVPRDFISLLQDAVFAAGAQRQLTPKAMRATIRAFHTAKLERLRDDDAERPMLARLTQKVTGRHARCFLADRDLTRSETFQALVDQRLLHRLQPRVPDPRDPARTYDAYSLDYGSYVLLVAEGRLLDDDLSVGLVDESEETVVPFGDGRRMRRIVIGLADLK
jgi:hypothetical protein